MVEVAKRLHALRNRGLLRIPIGVNFGKNKDTPAHGAADDYLAVLNELYEVGDYFVINVSSPNTPGLRDLQALDYLRPLVETVANRAAQRGGKSILVKISPDLADEDVVSIGRLSRELNLAGIVAANTTIRRDLIPEAAHLDRGGLSGPPLFARTCELLTLLRPELSSSQTLIASGGILSARQVQHVVSLGARLAQVYTAFIYLGPRCVSRMLGRPDA